MVRTEGYEYLDGTSMATPHVTGAAALAMSFRPDLYYGDIKNAILATGEYLPSLDGKIMTSARLNILHMLEALEEPKILSSSYVLSGEA